MKLTPYRLVGPSLQEAWALGAAYCGGWAEALGPVHVLRLEVERAGAVMLVPPKLRVGAVILTLIEIPPGSRDDAPAGGPDG